MVLSHSLIGVPLTYLLVRNKKDILLDKFQSNFIFLVGIVGSVFPDFDLILGFFINDLDHRKLFSHSVLPYLFFYLFVNFMIYYLLNKNQKFWKIVNLVFLVGVLSHLFLDFLVGGISLLAPFNSGIYGFDIYFDYPDSFFNYYFLSWYLLPEFLILLVSSYFIFKLRNIGIIIFLPVFFLITALTMAYFYN